MLSRRWLLARLKRSVSFLSLSVILVVVVVWLFLTIRSSNFLELLRPKKILVDQSIRPNGQFYPDVGEANYFAKRGAVVENQIINSGVKKFQNETKNYEEVVKDMVEGTKKIETAKKKKIKVKRKESQLEYNAHIFYYAWYGSPDHDGQWWHWNHQYIPQWDKTDKHTYPTGIHVPPYDIGSNFYPELGPYSSKDTDVIRKHFGWIANSSIGVVSVSWYPPGQADENGPPTDGLIPTLLNIALEFRLKICLHVEPYKSRSPATFRQHLGYVHATYSSHPAYYKMTVGTRTLPVFYIYDSYRITPEQWQRILSPRGDITVRNTDLDAVFLGLLVEYKHRFDIKKAGFDGFYTYFASNGFTYGSSWKNWKSLANFAFKNSLIFNPSVGPGYIDTRVRAWNSRNTQQRREGSYYETAWRTAVAAPARIVSITSFNEWHEGTQVEPAVPMSCDDYTYVSYYPKDPDFYLRITETWVKKLNQETQSSKKKKVQ